MYRHIQFAQDGMTVEGISFLDRIEEDRTGLLYLPETEESSEIEGGWKYVDGQWGKPEVELSEEEKLVEAEYKLLSILDKERIDAACGIIAGVALFSEEESEKERLIKEIRKLRGYDGVEE